MSHDEICRGLSFNPRVRAGRDPALAAARDAVAFQSTRPRGTRLLWHSPASKRRCFNPRVRAGRDKQKSERVQNALVSIHASARDATEKDFSAALTSPFQSTRPRGTRLPLTRSAL